MRVDKALVIANMLRIAREDLDGAEVLIPAMNRNAVYLCEQAAEKIIKAILISEDRHAGRTHELSDLVDMIPGENPLKIQLRDVEHLEAYATTYKYVTTIGRIKSGPSREELTRAAARVRELLLLVARRFEVVLDERDAPAGSSDPIR